MIQITRIRIELPREAVINCDITIAESVEDYKARIKTDLLKYNIDATIDIASRETKPCQFTEKTLRPHIGKKIKTMFGDGELIEANENERWVVDDSVKIKVGNGRVITIPASKVIEVVEDEK